MRLLKTDSQGLFKDQMTGAVINTNMSEYQKIVDSRKTAVKAQEMADRMCSLESELSEIKSLLAQLVKNGKH
jgi:hypothetical protein